MRVCEADVARGEWLPEPQDLIVDRLYMVFVDVMSFIYDKD
jgi:hypothetical protein